MHRHTRTQPPMVTHKRPHIATQTQIYIPAGTRTPTQAAPAQIHRSTCPGTHPAKGKRAQTQRTSAHAQVPSHTHLHSHTNSCPGRLKVPQLASRYPSFPPSGGPGPPPAPPTPIVCINSVPVPLSRTASQPGHLHSLLFLPTPGRPLGSKAHQRAAWVRSGASDHRARPAAGPPRSRK